MTAAEGETLVARVMRSRDNLAARDRNGGLGADTHAALRDAIKVLDLAALALAHPTASVDGASVEAIAWAARGAALEEAAKLVEGWFSPNAGAETVYAASIAADLRVLSSPAQPQRVDSDSTGRSTTDTVQPQRASVASGSAFSEINADSRERPAHSSGEVERLREALGEVVDALDVFRNGGDFPDFEAWEMKARSALKGERHGE